MPDHRPTPSVGPIAGLVLAGGLSRRMGGGQKGLRPLAGRPMIAHVLDRFAPQVGALAINANAPGYDGFGLPVLADRVQDFAGPLAGLLAGLDWAAGMAGVTHLASVATDAPFLPRDLVARLAAAADIAAGRPAMARSADGVQPVFALWPLSLRGDLADWLARGESGKVQTWASRHAPAFCDFGAEGPGAPDPFFNANRPEDLLRAEAVLADRAG